MIGTARLLVAVALLLSATQADAQPRRGGPGGPGSANPSAIVAAELGFARLAQEKGQWTAFRETADEDAVMFMPDAVNAQSWLKKRADPTQALVWQPYRVFVSCDGSYALSTGPWTGPDGQSGTFNTIWRRQQKGGYKWILDFGTDVALPRQEDVIIEGKIAQCGARGMRRGEFTPGQARESRPERDEKELRKAALIPDPPPLEGEGQSNDGSLRWRWSRTGSERSFEVTMRQADGEQSVVRAVVPVAAP